MREPALTLFSALLSSACVSFVNLLHCRDTNPRKNLASFVTTWAEPEALQLMQESANVNFIDIEQYPSSSEIEQRCVAMLANLLHAPKPAAGGKFMGAATVGSSEAIMLAGLAMKRRWQTRRRTAGRRSARRRSRRSASTRRRRSARARARSV